MHYYYQHDAEVAQQSVPGHRSRAEVVADLETTLLREYRDPGLVTKPEGLSQRGGAFYSLAAVRLMASLHADTGDVQVVDMRNDGAIPGLPDDAVVETRAVVDAKGAHPLPQRPLPPEMLGLVQHAKAYEQLAVRRRVRGAVTMSCVPFWPTRSSGSTRWRPIWPMRCLAPTVSTCRASSSSSYVLVSSAGTTSGSGSGAAAAGKGAVGAPAGASSV